MICIVRGVTKCDTLFLLSELVEKVTKLWEKVTKLWEIVTK